ncbi:hypothetical protein [Mycobacterium sp. OTB74]|uniref:hypothetical protein n=1 Tax=Mycobacterium sp. OTB74 TaxID=1853452 RepID=UPI002474AB1C|nr:hypothetical protein [Mycobacterium sp. OTB74]
MSVIRPQFLQVLLDDIARVGESAACVLALLRYVTDVDDEYNGRIRDDDGVMWWRASYTDIAASLGDSAKRYSVRRTLEKLESADEVKSWHPYSVDGDQTKAYRIPPEQPMCEIARGGGEIATALNGQVAKSPGGVAKSPGGVAKSPGGVAKSQRGGGEIARGGGEIAISYIEEEIEEREEREEQGEREESDRYVSNARAREHLNNSSATPQQPEASGGECHTIVELARYLVRDGVDITADALVETARALNWGVDNQPLDNQPLDSATADTWMRNLEHDGVAVAHTAPGGWTIWTLTEAAG